MRLATYIEQAALERVTEAEFMAQITELAELQGWLVYHTGVGSTLRCRVSYYHLHWCHRLRGQSARPLDFCRDIPISMLSRYPSRGSVDSRKWPFQGVQ